jgi:hypothetical protein
MLTKSCRGFLSGFALALALVAGCSRPSGGTATQVVAKVNAEEPPKQNV